MKILHVLSSPHLGGAEVVCLNLAAAHRAMGVDARVLCLEAGKPADEAKRRGIDTEFAIPARLDSNLSRHERRKMLANLFVSAVEKMQPDLVHSHVPFTNLLCAQNLPECNQKWLCTIHGSWRQFGYAPETVNQPWRRPYLLARHAFGDYWTTRSATRAVANSNYVAEELRSILVARAKIRVIYNGLPQLETRGERDAVRAKLEIPSDVLAIGAVGHLAPVKGFDILIKAFARVQDARAMLLIAGGDVLGNSATREALNELIRSLDLVAQVKIVSPRNLDTDFLPALDIFAVTSRTEGFSLVLLQAMQFGLPSVVTSAGGCVEVARPEQESVVYESPDVVRLAGGLERLIRDSALRNRLGTAAKERATTDFSLEAHAQVYLNLYSGLI